MRAAAGTLLLLLVGAGLACGVAEAASRWLAPGWQPTTGDRALFWRPHPRWGWAHVPGAEGRFRGPGWDVGVRINGHGLRDVARDYAKPEGTRRLLLLGDSFAWGYGVEREQGVAARLEALCPGWEVVNGAVSGWSTDQETLFLEDEGLRYAPDEVLLLAHENDLVGNSHDRMYGYPKPRFVLRGPVLELDNVPVPPPGAGDRLYQWLLARSYLANGVFRATGILVAHEVPALSEGRPLVDRGVSQHLLVSLAVRVRSAGAEPRFVLVPTSAEAARIFAGAAKLAGVPFLDLTAAFAGAPPGSLTLPGDPHWNARGHLLAARAIAAFRGCR